jgi:hypothetical protein
MVTSLSFMLVSIINNINVYSAIYYFISVQQIFLPLFFFGMFDKGFRDINDLRYTSILIKKMIKIFVVNWAFLIFIILVYQFLDVLKSCF